jgi:hypothetical protein
MPDPKQQFLCCTRKQIAILRCPKCKQLLGFCRACFTLFRNLQDLSATMIVNPGAALECSSCDYTFPTGSLEKHLAVRRDLVEAGLGLLASEELQLSAIAREDDPIDKYRFSLNRVGSGEGSGRDFTEDSREQSDKTAKKRLVTLLLLLIVFSGAIYYFLFFNTAPPPLPPPKKPTKPVRK